MADVEFQEFTVQVKKAITQKAIQFLEEAASEIESSAKRNSRVKTGQLKGSWNHQIDESNLSAQIGSPLENAIWEEFGTGEYAVHGDGRKGYWVYVEGGSGGNGTGKSYTLPQAKKIVAILRSKNIDAHYTNGKKPNHTLQRAFDSRKNAIIQRAQQLFGGI